MTHRHGPAHGTTTWTQGKLYGSDRVALFGQRADSDLWIEIIEGAGVAFIITKMRDAGEQGERVVKKVTTNIRQIDPDADRLARSLGMPGAGYAIEIGEGLLGSRPAPRGRQAPSPNPSRARESARRPLPRRPLRAREGDEVEVWIDASDNEAPWLAQHWYSGQGDPLYALSSTGFPQPESTISWALSNAKKSENEQWAHIEKTYGKKGAQKLMAIDPESREARALPDEKREDLEATDEIGRLVWALQEALKQGERISAEEGLQRQGVAPGTRW